MIRKTLLPIVLLLMIIAAAHIVLLRMEVLPEIYQQTPIWPMYTFIVPVTLIALVILSYRYGKNDKSLGKNFFAYTIIKLVGTLGFLSPWLMYKTDQSKPFVYQFLLIFFILLTAETILLVKLLNNNDEQQTQEKKES